MRTSSGSIRVMKISQNITMRSQAVAMFSKKWPPGISGMGTWFTV